MRANNQFLGREQSSTRSTWFIVGLTLCSQCFAQITVADFAIGYSYSNHILKLSVQSNASAYFVLEQSSRLTNFGAFAVSSGATNAVWTFPIIPTGESFYRVRNVSVFDPLDLDDDGIDDFWELSHGLNPLNSSDAILDPDQNGLSFYQEYFRERFGQGVEAQFFSRELSTFNFGQPTANVEAFSKVVSIFNGEHAPLSSIQEVYAREISIFNFGQPFNTTDELSREVSLFNFDPPSAPIEAFSAQVSVFNGYQHPLSTVQEIYSREISAFNFDQPTAGSEAISRQLSLFNNITNSP